MPRRKVKDTRHDGASPIEKSDESKRAKTLTLEERRLQNVEANQKFLQEFEILHAKTFIESWNTQKTSRKEQFKLKKPKEPIIRKSLRLQNITPEGEQLPPREPTFFESNENPPRIEPQLNLCQVLVSDTFHNDMFLAELNKIREKHHKVKPTTDLARLTQQLHGLSLKSVTKVVPDRIFSVTVHPSVDPLLVLAGDKRGKLGMWIPRKQSLPQLSEEMVACYQPQTRPIKNIEVNPWSPQQLYTCSYDGTLRCCHLDSGDFNEIYSTNESDDITVLCCQVQEPSTLLVGQGDGNLVVFDLRTSKINQHHEVADRMVRCISVHPTNRNQIAVADGNRVSLWDCRQLKQPLCNLPHSRTVESAYFSPITGCKILTTAADDYIRIYDSTDVATTKIQKQIRHNNHTGRWLTNFRATWHPRSEDVFIIGSMDRPRKIEIFNTSGEVIELTSEQQLNSVCSLTVFHPSVDLIVGANSSGRLHLFV